MIRTPVPCRLLCSECLATFPAEVMSTTGTGGWLESDLCYRSYDTFPYPYLVAVCPCCHWTAYIRDFEKLAYLPRYAESELGKTLREYLREQRMVYPGSRKYALAALSYSRAGTPSLNIADLHLRGIWCARHEGNAQAERCQLAEALIWFERALAQDLSGFERARVTYLLGELNRRLGRFDPALRWFADVGPAPAWLRSWVERMTVLAREHRTEIQIL